MKINSCKKGSEHNIKIKLFEIKIIQNIFIRWNEFFFFPILWFSFLFLFFNKTQFSQCSPETVVVVVVGGGLFVCLFVCLFCLYSISGYPVGAINFVFTTVILKYNSCRILLIYLFTYICISHAKGSSAGLKSPVQGHKWAPSPSPQKEI